MTTCAGPSQSLKPRAGELCPYPAVRDGLCIFHVPKLPPPTAELIIERGPDTEIAAFRTQFAELIAKTATKGRELLCRGFAFPSIGVGGLQINCPLMLVDPLIDGKSGFLDCKFEYELHIVNIVNSREATDRPRIELLRCKSKGPILVSKSAADCEIVIRDCEVAGGVHLTNVAASMISVTKCTSAKPSSMVGVRAHVLSCVGSRFENGLQIREFESTGPRPEVDLRNVQIGGRLVLDKMKVNSDGNDDGHGLAKGQLRCDRLVLLDNSTADVQEIDTDLCSFDAAKLGVASRVEFRDMNPGLGAWTRLDLGRDSRISFDRVDLSQAVFFFSPLDRLQLYSVGWQTGGQRPPLFSDGEPAFALEAFNQTINKGPLSSQGDSQREALLQRTIENYRQLVQNFEAKRDFSAAEEMHFFEMEAVRRLKRVQSRNRLAKLMRPMLCAEWAYLILSRYGTSYLRAAGVLVAMLLLATATFMMLGLQRIDCVSAPCPSLRYELISPEKMTAESLGNLGSDAVRVAAYVVSVATLQKEVEFRPNSVPGRLLQAILPIALLGQTALLLLALRRRFRRGASPT